MRAWSPARCAAGALLIAVGACAVEDRVPAEERGRRLASSSALSPSRFNAWSCTSCHAETDDDAGRITAGAPLGGAHARPDYWGGNVATLREAVDVCLQHFMRAPPLDPSAPDAQDLYAWLAALDGRGPKSAVAFTVVDRIDDAYLATLPDGDANRGAAVYRRACIACHGALHTGEGAPLTAAREREASLLPEDTLLEHAEDGPAVLRAVAAEKIRHGSFLGYAGTMPPFSRERLSDAQLADVLLYLGFTGR